VGGRAAPQRRQSYGEGLHSKEKIVSFSTGPHSARTHWKQTIFLLREPIIVSEGSCPGTARRRSVYPGFLPGTVVCGTFHCRKSKKNPRELDVEIHYTVQGDGEAGESVGVTVQMFKVR